MRGVDDYMEALPELQKELAEKVRSLILDNVPGVLEKLSYKMPFYHYCGMLLFMHHVKDGIYIAFMRGKDLVWEFPQLERKQRAIAASVTIRNKRDIVEKQVEQLIIAAAAWNAEAKRMKISFLKKPPKKKKPSQQ
jgi:hypothetical protein